MKMLFVFGLFFASISAQATAGEMCQTDAAECPIRSTSGSPCV